MQDNHSKYDGDFDEQFENHAWAEMAKLLDKEMPVAAPIVSPTNNRKYLLLLLLFLMVGAGTGWFMGRHHYVNTHVGENGLDISNTKESINSQNKTNAFHEATTVINGEATTTNTATTATSPNETEESERQDVGTIKGIQTGTENSSTLNTTSTNSQILRNSLPAYSSYPTPYQSKTSPQESKHSDSYQAPSLLQTKENERTLPLEEYQKTTKATKESSKTIQKAAEKPLSKELTRPIAMLEGLDLEEIAHTENVEELKFNQIIPAKKPFWKPHEIGGELGVYSRELGSIDGLSIGGVLRYKTKFSRWTLQTGLAYENIKTQGRSIAQVLNNSERFNVIQEADGASYDEDEIVDVIYAGNVGTTVPNTGAGGSNQAIEQVLVYNSYSRLHYLTLPFQVNYKPLAALELNVGMKLSYLLGTTLQNQNPDAMTTNLGFFSSNRGFKSTSAIENNKLAKLDARAYVGATWYPNPSLGISLKCNLGLNKSFPSLASDKWSNYRNNAFQASVVYLF